ncbi:MAG: SIS domain-containing protein [Zetaproteobacteria bacterium]|nr:MAG: SIS domain-containing protein [Zetaproteobacteria bacterium]
MTVHRDAAVALIEQLLDEGIALRRRARGLLPPLLQQAAAMICRALDHGGKIIACGNGGSAADAQHFAGELVNRFETDRPALAAIAITHDASVITSIGNDIAFEAIFARQVAALGRPGDLLLAISTSGNSANVVAAAEEAAGRGMEVIALTGGDGGALGRSAAVALHINIPHHSTPRVQEMHITVLHLLCALIDRTLSSEGGGDEPTHPV